MDKRAYENLAVVIDLNTIGMLKLLQSNNRDQRTGATFGIEDIIEQVTYALNAVILQNSANKISLFIFDEVDSDLIFPTSATDTYLIEILDFSQIKRTIFDRILGHMRNKQPVDKYHSRFVSALYKTVCCRVTRFKHSDRSSESQRYIIEDSGDTKFGYKRS